MAAAVTASVLDVKKWVAGGKLGNVREPRDAMTNGYFVTHRPLFSTSTPSTRHTPSPGERKPALDASSTP